MNTGKRCPKCGYRKSHCYKTAPQAETVIRYRTCPKCQTLWMTQAPADPEQYFKKDFQI